MAESNAINANTTGIVGNTGTGFTGTPLTQYLLNCGGATSSTISQVASTGTSGQVLTSAGAGALPSFATPALILVEKKTASTSSSIEFLNLTTDVHNVIITGIKPSATANLLMEYSVDNGSTWGSSNFSTEYWNQYNNATVNITSSSTNINIATNQSGTTSNHRGLFNLWFSADATFVRGFGCYRTGSTNYNNSNFFGTFAGTTNAIRFLYSGGATISFGEFMLYRMPTA